MRRMTRRRRAARFAPVVHAAGPPADGSVFVPLTDTQRVGVVGLLAAYLVVVALSAPWSYEGSVWVVAALATYVLVLALPFLVLPAPIGWFHPAVYNALIGLMTLARGLAMYSTGLPSHDG